MDLTDEQAIQTLEGLIFEFRSYSKLQDVLVAVRNGKQFLAGFDALKAEKQKELAALEERKATLEGEVHKAQVESSRAKTAYENVKAQVDSSLAALKDRQADAEAKFEEDKERYAASILDLEKRVLAKAKDLTELEEKFDHFKAGLGL